MLPKVCLPVIGFEFIEMADINWTLLREITPCSLKVGTNFFTLKKETACFSEKIYSYLPDCQSDWPRDLKRGSAAARMLRSRV